MTLFVSQPFSGKYIEVPRTLYRRDFQRITLLERHGSLMIGSTVGAGSVVTIDLIALDKGEISVKKVVDQLMDKMEQYANFGFSYMQEKMEVDPNYFFKETAFLHTFLSFLNQDGNIDEEQLEEL